MKLGYRVFIGASLLASLLIVGSVLLYYANMPQIVDKGEWVKLHKNQRINGYLRIGNQIYGGDIDLCFLKYFTPLKNVDAQTFEVCKNSGYARDKNHVYYPICEIYYEGDTWGGSQFKEYIVVGASPKTFIFLGDDYGIDGYAMYQSGVKVKRDNAVINHYQNHEHSSDSLCPICKRLSE